MPEPAPNPDVSSFEQLRAALLAGIPVHAPEWADHDVSDPGVTLLELFALPGREPVLSRRGQFRSGVGDACGRSRAVGGTARVRRGGGAEGSIRSGKNRSGQPTRELTRPPVTPAPGERDASIVPLRVSATLAEQLVRPLRPVSSHPASGAQVLAMDDERERRRTVLLVDEPGTDGGLLRLPMSSSGRAATPFA